MGMAIVTANVMNATIINTIGLVNGFIPLFRRDIGVDGNLPIPRGRTKGHVSIGTDVVAPLKVIGNAMRIGNTSMTNKGKE